MIHREAAMIFILVMLGLSFTGAALAGDDITQVLVTVKDDKLLAFSAYGNNWVAQKLYLKETVQSKDSEGNLAIVVTDKRLVGFSIFTNRWRVEDLKLDEIVENVALEGNAAIVTTNKRVLGFNARSGNWLETP